MTMARISAEKPAPEKNKADRRCPKLGRRRSAIVRKIDASVGPLVPVLPVDEARGARRGLDIGKGQFGQVGNGLG